MPATTSAASAASSSMKLPLDMEGGIGHNADTIQLLEDIGGVDTITIVTNQFYEYFWRDEHLKQFLGKLHYPLTTHGRRLAMYIAEMMGDRNRPWTRDTRASTTTCPYRSMDVPIATGHTVKVQARADAHWVAWHSVTRDPANVGRRFKLDDCRVWMRLLFWAAHSTGVAARFPRFLNYLVLFVGHFIPIYERTARVFARNEARWCLSDSNLARYAEDGYIMRDVVNVPLAEAAKDLPQEERYDNKWPY